MPESIACPECEKKLRVPDEAIGKRVKCPSCTAVFVAAIESAPPPRPAPKKSSAIKQAPIVPPRKKPLLADDLEEVDDDHQEEEIEERPRRRSRREEVDEEEEELADEKPVRKKKSGSWRSVRDGVNLVAISALASVGVAILNVAISFLITSLTMPRAINFNVNGPGNVQIDNSGFLTGFYIQTIITTLLVGSCLGLNLYGHHKILPIPDRKGISTRTMALVTFIFVCSAAGLWLISNIANLFLGGVIATGNVGALVSTGGTALWLSSVPAVLSGICWATSGITFLLVLRNICLSFGDKGLAKTVFAFLISVLSLVLTGIILSVVFFIIMGAALFSGMKAGPGAVNQQAQGAFALGAIGMVCFYGLLMVSALGLFIWYIILLFQVRSVLDRPSRN